MNYLKQTLLALLFLLVLPVTVEAKTDLYVNGETQAHVDTLIAVRVEISSDKLVNAAEGVLVYDDELLQFSSLEINETFDSWIMSPQHKESGIHFAGGATKAFTSNGSPLFTVSFLPKQVGNTALLLQNARVLRADGYGSDVQATIKGLNIEIENENKPENLDKEITVEENFPAYIESVTSNQQQNKNSFFNNKDLTNSDIIDSDVVDDNFSESKFNKAIRTSDGKVSGDFSVNSIFDMHPIVLFGLLFLLLLLLLFLLWISRKL